MSNALYQKYRPSKFAEVFGEEHIVNSLKNAIKLNQLSHAYIFSGSRGIGKTTIAKILAKVINCLNLKDGDACNQCLNCEKINKFQTMDVVEMDAASNNGVNEIRDLINTVNYLPTDLKTKVYILDEVHMLTIGAWNALLKTLEECPKHVIFIFATTEFHKIPLTIVSRCQCFSFKQLSEKLLGELIVKIAKNENIKIEQAAIEKIAYIAKGSARDTTTFLDQIRSYPNDGSIKVSDVNQIFGLMDNNKKIEFVNCLAANDLEKANNLITDLENDGINLSLFINEIFALLIEIYLGKHNPKYLQTMSSTSKEVINKVNMTSEQALKFAEIWEDLTTKLRFNPNLKYNLQLAVFKAMNLTHNLHQSSQSVEHKPADKNYVLDLINKATNNDKPQEEIVKPMPSLADTFEVEELAQPKRNISEPQQDKSQMTELINKLPTLSSKPVVNDSSNETKEFEDIKQKHQHDDVEFIKAAFLSIANFNNPDLKVKDSEIFDKMKSELTFNSDPSINKIIHAQKILLASKKGIVFIFEDEDSAKYLNQFFYESDFNRFMNKTFERPVLALGLTKKQAKELTILYTKVRKLTPISDLDISEINRTVKINKTTKEVAFEYFGDDLKIE